MHPELGVQHDHPGNPIPLFALFQLTPQTLEQAFFVSFSLLVGKIVSFRHCFFDCRFEQMWKLAVVMAACNLTGSIIGSRMALKHGTGFVRKMFLGVVLVLIARLTYDTFLR